MKILPYLLLAILVTSCLIPARAATVNGHPLVRVAFPGNHPGLGYTGNFGSAQFFGDGVHWVALDSQFTLGGLYYGSGGPLAGAAIPLASLPGSLGSISTVDYNFRGRASDGVSVFSVTTESGKLAYIQLDAAGTMSTVLDASALLMPGSGGLSFTRLGEPHTIGGKVAFVGFHQDGQETTFRGVYVLDQGELHTIADSNTNLPGGVGSFDGSSSQVGFDGTTVAFWGVHGLPQQGDRREGIFTATVGGPIQAIAVDGETIPGTGAVIESFQSPPSIVGDTVYFVAFAEGFESYLIRSRNGVKETIVKPGDLVNGGSLAQIAAAGFEVSNDTVYLNALLNGTSVIVAKTADDPLRVVVDNTVIPGIGLQFSVRDVEGDRLVFAERQTLWATLDNPAVPVILTSPASETYDEGAPVTLSVEAAGSGTLAYEWRRQGVVLAETGPVLEIPSFQAADTGNYNVKVSNGNGQVFASFKLELNSKPVFFGDVLPITVNAGFPLYVSFNIAGKAPFTYVWKKDGRVVESQVGTLFAVPEATAADSGVYEVTVTNALGEANSPSLSVTVNPAPANPVYDGRAFESRLSLPATIDGISIVGLNTALAHPNGVVINVYDALTKYVAIALLPASGAPSVLASITELNTATGKSYSDIFLNHVDLAGNVLFSAVNYATNDFGVFVKEIDGTLITLATQATEVPGRSDKSFRSVSGIALDGKSRLFRGSFDQISSIIVSVDSRGSRILLDETTPLPAAGFSVRSPQVYLFKNGEFYFVDSTADYQKTALFHYASDGTISLVLETGDPLGSEATLVGQFGSVSSFGGDLYAYETNHGLIRIGEHRADVALGPNAPVVEGGVMMSASFIVATDGSLAYLDQTYNTGSGVRQALFTWDGSDLHAIFSPTHIDGRRVLSSRFHGIGADGTLWAQVTYVDNTTALLANTGVPGESDPSHELPTMVYERIGENTLRIQVPNNGALEQSSDLKVWTAVPGVGAIDVEISESVMFFRLRQ